MHISLRSARNTIDTKGDTRVTSKTYGGIGNKAKVNLV